MQLRNRVKMAEGEKIGILLEGATRLYKACKLQKCVLIPKVDFRGLPEPYNNLSVNILSLPALTEGCGDVSRFPAIPRSSGACRNLYLDLI